MIMKEQNENVYRVIHLLTEKDGDECVQTKVLLSVMNNDRNQIDILSRETL